MEEGENEIYIVKNKKEGMATLCIAVREISLLFLRKKSQLA